MFLEGGVAPKANRVFNALRSIQRNRRASRCSILCVFKAFVLVTFSVFAIAGDANAQEGAARVTLSDTELPVRTDSPRDTFATFQRLSEEMEAALLDYTVQTTWVGAENLALLSDKMIALVDLEPIASASRREVGIATVTYLMDIFGRIGSPDLATVPDEAEMEAEGAATYRIPGTPLRIDRIATGTRHGEYLFGSSTIETAPRFYRGIRHLPLITPLDIESYNAFGPQLTGPLIPAAFVQAMPERLRRLWLGTPAWKVIAVAAFILLLAIALASLFRFLEATEPEKRLSALAWRTLLPLAILGATVGAIPYFSHQINVSGNLARILEISQTILSYLAYAWLFWLGIRMLFEWVIRSPRIPEGSLDANLLRLVSGILGILGVAVILAFGGQVIGLPILSVLAGLGIGGLAVALALRPTLENLVGGVMLYIDRPVRVGDFCSFGDQKGTVEDIGIRSTKLRALDRTVISVPNAQFADMQIVNWAHCDRMLIDETVGVRYETTPDQLRFLLARLREMLHAHPRVDGETVRVRLTGYGDSALQIGIRIYVLTREWNDFFAVREDIFLRVYDIVIQAGSGFAFPSQTLYMARDNGLDATRREEAETTVKGWRSRGRLPFPRLSRDEIERIEGTLDYPPYGSTEASQGDLEVNPVAAEPLSASSEPAEDGMKRPFSRSSDRGDGT
jgi:MscS family membrane protein